MSNLKPSTWPAVRTILKNYQIIEIIFFCEKLDLFSELGNKITSEDVEMY